MSDQRQLADFVDRASRRYDGASGRRLAEIAKRDGYDVSHSTLNKIRARNYESVPSVETLRAIAHLADVAEAEVFNAASPDSAWAEYEKIFTAYQNAKARVIDVTAQYARLRGISVSDASTELEQTSKLYDHFMRGLKDWVPPWAAESASVGHRDTSAVTVAFGDPQSAAIDALHDISFRPGVRDSEHHVSEEVFPAAARVENDPKEDPDE